MTSDELRATCNKAIKQGLPDYVTIVMRGKWGDKDTRLLAGRGSPVGRVVSDYFRGPGIVVMFNANEVLAWLDKKETARD